MNTRIIVVRQAAQGIKPKRPRFGCELEQGIERGDIALLGSLSYLAPLLSTLLLVLAGRAQPHWIQAIAIALLMLGAWISLRSTPDPART